MQIEERASLSPLTTFGIGGEARFLVHVTTLQELKDALLFAKERQLPVCMLGGGSNILVADDGYPGVVIKIELRGKAIQTQGDTQVLSIAAGESWDDVVQWSIANELYGLENLSGIPGTVGGAVVANIGAYGAQCSDTLQSVEVFDRESNTIVTIEKEACAFAYHESLFAKENDRYVVVSATFVLSKNPQMHLSYKDHRFDLSALKDGQPTLSNIRETVLRIREQKGYLVMEGREGYKSAGSFFHMPYVTPQHYAHVLSIAQTIDAHKEERLRPWSWVQRDGSYKLAPGFLLEYTPYIKGFRRGSVGISPKHILSLINIDHGTAREIAQLAQDIQTEVEKIFGIRLHREVRYIGSVI